MWTPTTRAKREGARAQRARARAGGLRTTGKRPAPQRGDWLPPRERTAGPRNPEHVGLRPRKARARIGFTLATVVPAVAAAAGVLALAPLIEADDGGGSASLLARAADQPTLGESSRALRAAAPADGGTRPAPPRRLSIPAARVQTTVEAVGVRKGGIVVPDVGHAGWYSGGPRPGEKGRAVIVGHLDTRRGPGLFARISGLERGTGVAVTDRAGQVHRYRVVGTAQVQKARFPTGSVYGGGRRPVLVLVTCGGPYIEGRGYRDNVIVYAQAA